jgi:5'-3' exonuclease
MGIPYYFYTITKTYDGIVLSTLPPDVRCTHLYFDFNGLIHPSAQKCLASLAELAKIPTDIEKAIMSTVWKDTMAIVKMVDPSATVQIFIDGVAPIAKMAQQRKRRFMSVFRKTLTGETPLWDANAISPGTAFMTRLNASIRAYIRNSKAPYTFRFSSSDEAGEGEHKIFAQIECGTAPDDVKIIYGMDADLIMLALFSHLPNIYLLRENVKAPGEYIYLSIDELRKGILKDLVANYQWTIVPSTDPFDKASRETIETYGVVCFLLGNDFIPHPIGLNLKKGGLEDLLMQAGKVWTTLGAPIVNTDTETIHWLFMAQLLEVLGQHENETVFDVVSDHHKKRPMEYKTKDLEIDAYPLVHKSAFTTDMLFKIDRKKWRQYYYKALFHSNINDTTVITNACDLYIKGILWTYHYYKRKPKDNQWYYPYNYAPTLRDATNYLNSQMSHYEGLPKTKEWTGKDVFCAPIVQLLSILPKESADVLPAKYKKIMLEHTGLQYMYPSTYNIQTFMKTKLWECSQDIPPLNIEFVKKCVMGATA